MGVCEIKNVRIGEGRPKAIVSLMDAGVEGLKDTCERALEGGADLVEWRADFWPAIHDAQDVAQTSANLSAAYAQRPPIIFTCRTKAQGGSVEMDADEYVRLLEVVLADGESDIVDIELGIGDEAVAHLIARAHEQGALALVSHHDFEKTPSEDEMVDILLHMSELGADIPKLAVMASRSQDAHALMRATHRVFEQVNAPLITMAMGTAGQTTRLTGEVFGSAATFCALGKVSAPGQVELAQAIATMDAIHRERLAGEV